MVSLLLMVALSMLAPYFFSSGSRSFVSIDGAEFIRVEFVTSAKDVVGALTFLNGFRFNNPLSNSPLWSLSLEAWYYVVAASVFLWPTRKLLACMVFAVVIFFTYRNYSFFVLAPVWFSGFGLAMLHQCRPQMNNKLFGAIFVTSGAAMILSVVNVLAYDVSGNEVDYGKIDIYRLAAGGWFAAFLARRLQDLSATRLLN